MKSSVTNILVDGPAWVGDMIMAQTLFKLLRQNYPQATIDVLAPAWTRALLEVMPEVNQAIALPCDHGELGLSKRYKLAVNLREKRYDWAILMRNSFKSALIPFWARIPRRTGWLGEYRYGLLNDARKLNKQKYPLMIERFMALGLPLNSTLPRPYPYPSFQINEASRHKTLQKLQIETGRAPILILCPGAEYGSAKRWPAEYFAEVANKKLVEGWQVWALGSEKDHLITETINILCDHKVRDFAGKTSLAEALELLSLADCVIANDSGLMHMAAALGRKVLVIYGSSSAQFTPPLSASAQQISINLSCSPCFERECPLKHTNCLNQLTPDRILQAMEAKVPEGQNIEEQYV